jgi:hypothetical protein
MNTTPTPTPTATAVTASVTAFRLAQARLERAQISALRGGPQDAAEAAVQARDAWLMAAEATERAAAADAIAAAW